MSKFMFLDALTYAQTKDNETFKKQLQTILEKYPEAEVTPLATEMLKNMNAGMILSGSGLTKGMVWNTTFGKEDNLLARNDSAPQFKPDDDSPQLLLLLYPLKKTNKNDLLYAVADYNFSHYVISTFDLIFDDQKNTGVLQVKGFSNFRNLKQYTDNALKDKLFERLGSDIIPIPISVSNYGILQAGQGLNSYMTFFNKTYGESFPKLLALWSDKQSQENKPLEPQLAEDKQPESPTKPVSASQKEKSMEVTIQPVNEVKTNVKDINISTISAPGTEKMDEEDAGKSNSLNEAEDLINKGLNTSNKVKSIYSNPIEGLKGLLKGSGSLKVKLTKAEKAAQKKQTDEQKNEKARLDKIQKELDKARKDSISFARNAEIMAQKEAEKQKQDSLNTIKKQKEDSLKAKENERKARKNELKEKEQARNEKLKSQKKERDEKLKTRKLELREKEQKRKEQLKAKEEERKAKLKAHEEDLKEKERLRKEQSQKKK